MVLPDILADPDFLTKPPGSWFLALVFLLQYPGPGYIRKTADILFIGSKLSVPAQLHPPHWAPHLLKVHLYPGLGFDPDDAGHNTSGLQL